MTPTRTVHDAAAEGAAAALPVRTNVWLVAGPRPAAALTAGTIAAASSVHAALIAGTLLYLVPAALLWGSPVRRPTTMPTAAPALVKDSAHGS